MYIGLLLFYILFLHSININNNHNRKSITVLGHFAAKQTRAILIIEKTAFNSNDLHSVEQLLSSITLQLSTPEESHHVNFVNDKYISGIFTSSAIDKNSIKITVIDPANDDDIKKYTEDELVLVKETPQVYQNVTRAVIIENALKNNSLNWIHNILDKKAELERVILDDGEFVLVSDFQWDEKTINNLHIISLPRLNGLCSLRDLRQEHVPLLNSMWEKGCNAIKDKFGISRAQLRAFVHYLPSFYHFHVHFTHIGHISHGMEVERAHLLQDIIDNLQMDSDYYAKKTMYFKVKSSSKLAQEQFK